MSKIILLFLIFLVCFLSINASLTTAQLQLHIEKGTGCATANKKCDATSDCCEEHKCVMKKCLYI